MKLFSPSRCFRVADRSYQIRSWQLSPDGPRATVRFTGPDEHERETEFHVHGAPREISSERFELALRYALYRRILNPRTDGVRMNPFLG